MFKRILFTLFLVIQLSQAQSTRIVLLEEATNASCAPCAAYNPGLQNMVTSHLGGIISVRYHAWWPGSNDPMYQANTADNRNRINYYGISGVPGYALDGHFYGVPSNPDLIKTQMYERLSKPAPVRIRLQSHFTMDSVFVQVELEALEDLSDTSLHLRVALIERLISFSSAPGSNGEKDFGDVMRTMLPDANGTAVSALNAGDLLSFSFKTAIQQDVWNAEDMSAIAWLQSDNTKEVFQAQIDFPTSILETDAPELDLLTADSTIRRPFKIVNRNEDTLHVRIYLKNVNASPGWSQALEEGGVQASELERAVLPADSLLFNLVITTADRGSVKLDLFAENLDDPGFYGEGYGYGFTRSYSGVIPENNDVLLVDDDGGANYQAAFEDIFDGLNIRYLTVEQAQIDTFSKQVDLNQYRLIVWNVSWGSPVFIPSDIQILKTYLDAGGTLLIMGQDIGWDVFDPQGSSGFSEAQDFYHNYLGADFVDDYAASSSMSGVVGDPIGDGMSFSLTNPYGNGNFYPDAIASYQGKGQPVFNYGNGKIGMLRYDSGTFRTVYSGVGLEQIAGSDNQTKFLKRTLAWTANLTGLPSQKHIPATVALFQNYPNPFGANTVSGASIRTSIRYRLAAPGDVELSIYNMLGQKVRTLVRQKQQAGWHSVPFDGANLANGVYLYRLRAGGQVRTRKMMLLR